MTRSEVSQFILEYLSEFYREEEEFSLSYNSLVKDLGLKYNEVVQAIRMLIKQGYLTKVKEGIGPGNPPAFMINSSFGDCRGYPDNLESREPNFEKKSTIGSVDIFECEGMRTRVIYDDKYGYVIPIADIANAMGVSRTTLYNLINRNQEVFEDHVVKVRTEDIGVLTMCLTRKGIITYLQKTATNQNMKEATKQKIIKFQKWATEKLDTLISEGEVKTDVDEHKEIFESLKELTGIDDEGLEKIVYQIQEPIKQAISEGVAKVVNYTKNIIEEEQKKKYGEVDLDLQKAQHLLEEYERDSRKIEAKKDALRNQINARRAGLA